MPLSTLSDSGLQPLWAGIQIEADICRRVKIFLCDSDKMRHNRILPNVFNMLHIVLTIANAMVHISTLPNFHAHS